MNQIFKRGSNLSSIGFLETKRKQEVSIRVFMLSAISIVADPNSEICSAQRRPLKTLNGSRKSKN